MKLKSKPTLIFSILLIFLLVFEFLEHQREDLNVPAPLVMTRHPASEGGGGSQNVGRADHGQDTVQSQQKADESVNFRNGFQEKLSKIQERLRCYESHSCDLPETDPKSAYFSLGQEISSHLQELRENADWMTSFSDEIQNLARQTILVEDGYVQEASLRLLQSFPPNEENWQSLKQALDENPEALFVQQALDELERYQRTNQRSEVSATVQSLLRGPHFTSEVVSENIFRFIDDQSVKGFESALKILPPNSKVAENVSRYIREYYRMKLAG